MNKDLQETIVAIATPIGEGAISLVRMSGAQAIEIASRCFKGKCDLRSVKSQSAHFGRIIDNGGNTVDDVVCTIFRAPRSYSGEDIAEISCHGGMLVTKRVMECLIDAGAKSATPGEFTKRAFLNGKIDLIQAEAVADLIKAQSDRSQQSSLSQLEGRLSKKIYKIREQLIELIGLLELDLDFVEEGIELIDKKKIVTDLENIIDDINELMKTYKYGKILRDGIKVALVGIPNGGKSSILNTLLSQNRAIVTDIPGTTRDFIEEKVNIGGILFRVTDTAGIQKTEDPIEKEGIKRTWKIVENSEIVVLVHDTTHQYTNSELEFLDTVQSKNHNISNIIIAENKTDLIKGQALNSLTTTNKRIPVVYISTISKGGVDTLKRILVEQVPIEKPVTDKESATITNVRHYSALLRTYEHVNESLKSINAELSGEFVAVDLRAALSTIGEIVGAVTTEEIIDSIFKKFCIGK